MPTDLLGKTILNQYQIEEFIAITPVGEHYRAVDLHTGRFAGFTLLPKAISDHADAFKEIDSNAKKLLSLSYPTLKRTLGVYQTPTLAIVLEEWVDGPTLRQILAAAPLPLKEVLIIAKGLCSSLEVLHKTSVLHLHLAPELITLDKGGKIHLGGLAFSKPTQHPAQPHPALYPCLYTAPEILENKETCAASDIYSLSILLYELLTGKWINGGQAPKTIKAQHRFHLSQTPRAPIHLRPEIPEHVSKMLLWALRKKPEERLQSTTELLSSLALAAQIPLDEIPPQIDRVNGPVSWEILQSWQSPPPPAPNPVSADVPPLQDRLANLSDPQNKKKQLRLIPTALGLGVAVIFSLILFIQPAPVDKNPTPFVFTPYAQNITPIPTITPSPRPTDVHGGRLIFTCTRGEYNQLCMVNRDGSDYTQLTNMAANNYYPIFTRDGSSILFSSNRNGPFDLYLQDFTRKKIYQITENIGNVISPDYSPDGSKIVFANRVADSPTAIWMMNADGLNPKPIYAGNEDIVAVTWSPKGDKIAYAISLRIPQEYEIFTMNVDGKNHVRISRGLQGIGGSVDWSSDGAYLLIHAGAYGEKNIYKLEIHTGNAIQLTQGGNNAGASYSPDGKYIVFNSLRNDEQADLYIMRADGTNQVQLTNHPEPEWGARWID